MLRAGKEPFPFIRPNCKSKAHYSSIASPRATLILGPAASKDEDYLKPAVKNPLGFKLHEG